jgi:hypothetical protein
VTGSVFYGHLALRCRLRSWAEGFSSEICAHTHLDLCGPLSKALQDFHFQPKIKECIWRRQIQVEKVVPPSSPLPDDTAPKP